MVSGVGKEKDLQVPLGYPARSHKKRRCPYILPQTFGSNADIPLRIIQEISGHNNLEQLQHYERGEAGSSQRSDRESFHAFLHRKSFDSMGKPQRHSHLTSITKRSLPALPVLPVLTSVV